MKNRKFSLVFIRLGIVLFATLTTLLIAELALRIFWENPFRGEGVSLYVEVRMQPANKDYWFDRSPIDSEIPSVSFRSDTRGYIEPAIRFSKPDHTIAFFGGSTTECLLVQEDLRFPALVSTLLEGKGVLANVLNVGRSGNDTQNSLNNLLNHVVSDRPDVALLMHAANDIGHLSVSGSYQGAMGNVPTLSAFGRPLLERVSTYSSLFGLIRHARRLIVMKRTLDDAAVIGEGGKAVSEMNPSNIPVDEYKYRLRAFVSLSRAFDIIPVLMTQPSSSFRNELTPGWINESAQALFNQTVRDVAAQENVDLIDLVEFLTAKEQQDGKFESDVFYDGIHVTDYGSRLYAEHISEQLLQILSK